VCLQRLHPNAKIVTPLIANFNRRADDLHQLPQPARPAATLSTPRKPISKWPSNRLPAYVLPLKALDSSEGEANDWTQMLRRQIVLDLSVAMGAFIAAGRRVELLKRSSVAGAHSLRGFANAQLQVLV
jgi:hypothetical protein